MTMNTYIKPSNRLKYWEDMLAEGRLKPEILVEGDFLESNDIRRTYNVGSEKKSNKKNPKKKKKEQAVYTYYTGGKLKTVTEETLFRYEAGRHSEGQQVAGVYLQKVIPPEVQARAFAALNGLKWEDDPHRPETIGAKERQRGQAVAPKEYGVGHSHNRVADAHGQNLQHCPARILVLTEHPKDSRSAAQGTRGV